MSRTLSSHEDRAARKERTRRKMLDAALALVEERGFAALSLRELTREVGIVPGAFYRHYENLDQLGLDLVAESFGSLRLMLRDARGDGTAPIEMVTGSVDILVRHVKEHRGHFRFIARETAGGSSAVRAAIRQELRLFRTELAVDLARLPFVREWPTDDLYMLADLIVHTMVTTAEALLDVDPDRPEEEAEVIATVEKQLRLVILGIPHWRAASP